MNIACNKSSKNFKQELIIASAGNTEYSILSSIIANYLVLNSYYCAEYPHSVNPEIALQLLIDEKIDLYVSDSASFVSDSVHDQFFLDPRYFAALVYTKYNKIDGLSIATDFAENNKIRNLSDLSSYINRNGVFKLVCSQYFYDSDHGLKNIERLYNFRLKRSQIMIINNADNIIAQRAVLLGLNNAVAAMSSSTDGILAYNDLLFLKDDMNLLPKSKVEVIMRKRNRYKFDEIEKYVKTIVNSIDEESMQKLNAETEISGKDKIGITQNFLNENERIY